MDSHVDSTQLVTSAKFTLFYLSSHFRLRQNCEFDGDAALPIDRRYHFQGTVAIQLHATILSEGAFVVIIVLKPTESFLAIALPRQPSNEIYNR
jgi:hypothetical protein